MITQTIVVDASAGLITLYGDDIYAWLKEHSISV